MSSWTGRQLSSPASSGHQSCYGWFCSSRPSAFRVLRSIRCWPAFGNQARASIEGAETLDGPPETLFEVCLCLVAHPRAPLPRLGGGWAARPAANCPRPSRPRSCLKRAIVSARSRMRGLSAFPLDRAERLLEPQASAISGSRSNREISGARRSGCSWSGSRASAVIPPTRVPRAGQLPHPSVAVRHLGRTE